MNELFRESVFWIAAAACAAAEIAIILSSIRSVRKTKRHALRETIWAILPALALAWILIATWGEVRRAGAHEQMTMPMPTSSS